MQENPGRVLIADDDALFRKITTRLLESHGHTVVQVEDVPAALERLANESFDLLVADVNMPGNDGLAVLHRSQVPVLIVTGEPSIETAVEALRGAAVDYLAKPFNPERLLERVAAGIARGRTLRMLDDAEQNLREQLDVVALLRTSLAISGGSAARESSGAELPADEEALLSQREREVLAAFRAKPRVSEVAKQLFISPHTVKNHLKSIFRKLDVNSQTELLTRLGDRA